MAYNTPSYNYGQKTSQLAQNKALTDAYQDFGRFMGQERHRRGLGDMGRQFKREFPRVGSNYNRRGMWNSGLRREGQQQYASDYGRAVERANYDQAAEESLFQQQRTIGDAGYQQALLALMEEMQHGRTANYDPFSAVRGLV